MRVLKTMLVSIACLFVLLAHAAAQSLPTAAPQELGFSPERLARISSWLRDDIAKGTIPGAVLMIVRHGKVAHFEAAGSLDPATHDCARDSRSSARKGFPASSAASVVSGPWPGCTTVSGG